MMMMMMMMMMIIIIIIINVKNVYGIGKLMHVFVYVNHFSYVQKMNLKTDFRLNKKRLFSIYLFSTTETNKFLS